MPSEPLDLVIQEIPALGLSFEKNPRDIREIMRIAQGVAEEICGGHAKLQIYLGDREEPRVCSAGPYLKAHLAAAARTLAFVGGERGIGVDSAVEVATGEMHAYIRT